MKKIFVTVTCGVAEVMEDTVPQGYEVEIIDFDNINEGDEYPSKEALAYAKVATKYYTLEVLPKGSTVTLTVD